MENKNFFSGIRTKKLGDSYGIILEAINSKGEN